MVLLNAVAFNIWTEIQSGLLDLFKSFSSAHN